MGGLLPLFDHAREEGGRDVPLFIIVRADGDTAAVQFQHAAGDALAVVIKVHLIHEVEFGEALQVMGFVIEL